MQCNKKCEKIKTVLETCIKEVMFAHLLNTMELIISFYVSSILKINYLNTYMRVKNYSTHIPVLTLMLS